MSWLSIVTAMLVLLGTVAICAGLLVFLLVALEDGSAQGKIAAASAGLCIVVVSVTGIWLLTTKFGDNRPCVREATTLQYNPATKTVMPVTYCSQYGEWGSQ